MTPPVTVLGRGGLVLDLLTRVFDLDGTCAAGHTTTGPVDGVTPALADQSPVALLVDPEPGDWRAAQASGSRIVLLCHDLLDGRAVVDAVFAGADAILHTDAGPHEIRRVITVVAAGGTVLDPTQARAVVETARTLAASSYGALRLTPREGEILACITDGMSVKQTARTLGITTKTVENLQTRLFRKLGARNRAQAVMRARELGVMPEEA